MSAWGPGVIAGLILLFQTVIAAISVNKNKRYAAAYRWRKKMEPIHLDLLDWAYEVQKWASLRGQRKDLPALPASVSTGWHDEDEDDDLKVLESRMRHERKE